MSAIEQVHNEEWIQHEVQLRLHEGNFKSIQNTLDKLEAKMDRGFDKLDSKIDNKITGLYHLIIGAISIPVLLFVINLIWSK